MERGEWWGSSLQSSPWDEAERGIDIKTDSLSAMVTVFGRGSQESRFR